MSGGWISAKLTTKQRPYRGAINQTCKNYIARILSNLASSSLAAARSLTHLAIVLREHAVASAIAVRTLV